MKKMILLVVLLSLTLGVSCQVISTNLEIRKSAPQLKLNGTSATIDFYNSDLALTQSSNLLTLSGGDFSVGSNNIFLTGTIGSTGSRSSKGWFNNLEILNVPTINGVSMTSIYEPVLGNPPVSGYVLSSTTGGVRSWVAGGTGGGTWGSITGTLSDQTDLQNALNAKANLAGPTTFTNTITLPSTTSIGDVSSTEITYVNGATSNIQAQLNDTTTLDIGINAQTASYTLALTDNYKLVTMSSTSAMNLTVPPNSSVAFPIGANITVVGINTGQVTFVQGSGVTIYSADSDLKLRVRYSSATLIKIATDTWLLIGDIAA